MGPLNPKAKAFSALSGQDSGCQLDLWLFRNLNEWSADG